jgi:hypothetical protein
MELSPFVGEQAHLPRDIIDLICSWLPLRHLCTLAQTNRRYHRIIDPHIEREISRLPCYLFYYGGHFHLTIGTLDVHPKSSPFIYTNIKLVRHNPIQPDQVSIKQIQRYLRTGFMGIVFIDLLRESKTGYQPAASWIYEIFTSEHHRIPTNESYMEYCSTTKILTTHGHPEKWNYHRSDNYQPHDYDRVIVMIGDLSQSYGPIGEIGSPSINTSPHLDSGRRYYGMHYTPACYCYTPARQSWCGPVGVQGPPGNQNDPARRKHQYWNRNRISFKNKTKRY